MHSRNRCKKHAFVETSRTLYFVYIFIDRSYQCYYLERLEDLHKNFYNNIFEVYNKERSCLNCLNNRN